MIRAGRALGAAAWLSLPSDWPPATVTRGPPAARGAVAAAGGAGGSGGSAGGSGGGAGAPAVG